MKNILLFRIIVSIALITVYGLGFVKIIPFMLAAIVAIIILILFFVMQHF